MTSSVATALDICTIDGVTYECTDKVYNPWSLTCTARGFWSRQQISLSLDGTISDVLEVCKPFLRATSPMLVEADWPTCEKGDPLAIVSPYNDVTEIWISYFWEWDVLKVQAPPTCFDWRTGTDGGHVGAIRQKWCPPGFRDNSSNTPEGQPPCIRPIYDRQCPNEFGDPITLNGEVIENDIDYSSADSLLRVERYYNSLGAVILSGETRSPRWLLGYGGFLHIAASHVIAFRPDGRRWIFSLLGDAWKPLYPLSNRLGQIEGGWRLLTGDNILEIYDASGRLLSQTTKDGRSVSLQYASSPPNQLANVTDLFGRRIAFQYTDAQFPERSALQSATLPDGGIVQYTTDRLFGEFDSVTYPDGSTRRYDYEYPDNVSRRLQTITDENGSVVTTFTHYGSDGSARSTEQSGGVSRFVRFDSRGQNGAGNVTITDPLGSTATFTYAIAGGLARLAGQSQPAGSGCAAASRSHTYDANGNTATRTDFNGNQTRHTYDLGRNLEIQRTEAYGKPEARTVSTQWHTYWRLPIEVAEALKRTTYVYNGDTYAGQIVTCAPPAAVAPSVSGGTVPIGVLCRKVEQATTDSTGVEGFAATASGSARVRSYTYNEFGQMLTATDPRGYATSYAYYADTTPEHTLGDLRTVTNQAGHVTSIIRYDANGRPLALVDPNGLTTELTNDLRGRLIRRRVGNETTDYGYDAAGQLVEVALPGGKSLRYTYDAAHRLSGIQDSFGNRIGYTLDAAGNRLKEDVTDPSGVLVRTQSRVYDALSRLQNIIQPQQ